MNIKRYLLLWFGGLLILSGVLKLSAQTNSNGGRVCGEPADSACASAPPAIFKPFAIRFLASEYNTGSQSEEFYAVLLSWKKKGGRKNYQCYEIGEDQRNAAQQQFPDHKAFTFNYYCYKSTVWERFLVYKSSELTDSMHFLAIYGGDSLEKAEKVLNRAKKTYPAAKIVKMYALVI